MLEMKVRTAESSTHDVFVNVNDLIIELMLESEKKSTQVERDLIKKIILRLTEIRNRGHAKD